MIKSESATTLAILICDFFLIILLSDKLYTLLNIIITIKSLIIKYDERFLRGVE